MNAPDSLLLDAAGEALLSAELCALEAGADLSVRFPGLPRRFGRGALAEGELALRHGVTQRARWRRCDAAALRVLCARGDAATAMRLFEHGDRDEKLMATRALLHLADEAGLRAHLAMLQTSNDQALFEAGFLDSSHAAAVLEDAAWNRFLLKAAFIGLPLERIVNWRARANPVLSRMLQDLQAERVAAQREVWPGTAAVIAAAH